MSITLTFSGGQTNESSYAVITVRVRVLAPDVLSTLAGFMGAEKSRLVRDDVLKGC